MAYKVDLEKIPNVLLVRRMPREEAVLLLGIIGVPNPDIPDRDGRFNLSFWSGYSKSWMLWAHDEHGRYEWARLDRVNPETGEVDV